MQHQIKEISAHESVTIFRALGSLSRARILELLSEREMNIGEISTALALTQPSITKHIQILEEAGLVTSDYVAAPQGMQKRCRSVFERLLVDLAPRASQSAPRASQSDGFAEIELPVGMFATVDPHPTCGLASREKIIGILDAPVSFFLPERANAEILWTSAGSIEYAFPNTLPSGARVKAIELVMEAGSEAPGYKNNWPSDITLWVNDVEVGTWTSPGDFGGTRGQLNPGWYPDNMNQWGVLQHEPVGRAENVECERARRGAGWDTGFGCESGRTEHSPLDADQSAHRCSAGCEESRREESRRVHALWARIWQLPIGVGLADSARAAHGTGFVRASARGNRKLLPLLVGPLLTLSLGRCPSPHHPC